MKTILNRKRPIFSALFCLILVLILSFNSKLYKIEDSKLNINLFSLSIFLSVFSSCLLSFKFNFKNSVNKLLTIIIFILSVFSCYAIIELLNKSNMFDINLKRFVFNFIVSIFLHLFVYCLTNKVKLTIMLSNSIVFILGLINYTVICFRGTPLVPWDVLSFKTAISIAGNYTFEFTYYLFLGTLIFITLMSLATKANYHFKVSKTNIALRFICFFTIIIFTGYFYKTDIIDFFDFDTNLWRPSEEYSNNGFLASFVKQSKNLFNEKPQDYSISTVNNIMSSYINEKSSSNISSKTTIEDSPNIIIIMNESFADLSLYGSFNTSEDYIPYFRNLTKNTITGIANVSIFGGQTPNSEWEFLTNNSMAFMPYRTVPYQQYIHSKTPSLATILKDQGYNTSGIHPWYGSGYRRNAIYPLLGFDSFDSLETLKDLEFLRNYPTDISTYNYLIKMFEEKDSNKKFFNFTVTMQNHSGYDFEDYESTITLTDIENCNNVEQYLSIIKESDNALKYIIDYFSNIDEKTIILFFGDHQPPYLEDEFWDFITGPDSSEIDKYLTPFVLWANYDIESKDVGNISLNYLSLLLLDVAGLETTPYMDFLRDIYEKIPVITGNGYFDTSGKYYALDEESEYSRLIRNYQILQYNNVFDSKNRVNKIFSVR